MIRKRQRTVTALFLVSDLLATLAAFYAAWQLRFEVKLIPLGPHEVPSVQPYLLLALATLLIWPVILYFHGLYQPRRSESRFDELMTLPIALLLGTMLLLSFTAVYRPRLPSGDIFTYSRAFLALFFALDLALVATTRVVLRSMVRSFHLRGQGLQRILIVGAGRLGLELAQKLRAHREMGLDLVGFLDDDPGKAGRSLQDVPVLGTLDTIKDVLERMDIGQVLVALPLDAYKKVQRLLEQVNNECVTVRLVPDVLQYATLRATLEDFDGIPIINLSQVPLEGWRSLVKRCMDIALSGLGLLLALPWLPLVAFLIWLEDRGPVFYRQERMGLDGRRFMMLKLRSMRVNAESSTGPIWAIRDDPRRTRVGSLLRRSSLDELPQLWNVFRGEMSIVGPRPERPAFVDEFKHKLPNYMLRHRVKAGITGWAQVHGWRGNTSIGKRLQYDLYYIQNWTLGLDFKILWLTLRHGMRHNAY